MWSSFGGILLCSYEPSSCVPKHVAVSISTVQVETDSYSGYREPGEENKRFSPVSGSRGDEKGLW
jgi:hypothetical protein